MYNSSSSPIQKEVLEQNDPKKAALRRRLARPKTIPGDPLASPDSTDPNVSLIQKRKRGF